MLNKGSQFHYEFAPATSRRASESLPGLPGLTKLHGLALPSLEQCEQRDQRQPRPLIGENLPPLTANIEAGFTYLPAQSYCVAPHSFIAGDPAPLRSTCLSARGGGHALTYSGNFMRGLPAIDRGRGGHSPRNRERDVDNHVVEREEPDIEAACKKLWAAMHTVPLYIAREMQHVAQTLPPDPLGQEKAITAMLRGLIVPGVQKAVKLGGKINWHNPETNGETLLQRAARHGEDQVMRFLIERKADAQLVDFAGRNALHWAAAEGQARCVKLLIEQLPRSSAVDYEEDEGCTALHFAALHGHVHCVRLLIRAKADHEACNFNNETPLDLAFGANHHQVVRHLLLCRTDEEEVLLQEMDRECNVERRKQIMVKLANGRKKKKKGKKGGDKKKKGDGEGKKKKKK